MDDGKYAAQFVTEIVKQNINVIWEIGKNAFGTLDEVLRIKLKIAYTNYLTNVGEKYSKSKSFFIRNQAVDLYSYYVPTGIECDSTKILTPSFRECIKKSERIVITGSGGSGKTVLMKHLFLDCIQDKNYTPVLLELRELNDAEITLDEFIASTLEKYGFNISGEFVERAKEKGHLCFFLDGYDEVNYSFRKKLIKQIDTLSEKFTDCPIFISSRPDDDLYGIQAFNVYKILPLNLESAINLISKLPYDTTIKDKFIKDLSDGLFEQHISFLSNPLLLSIMLLTYGENAEIPSKLSLFYNQAYEALFQRHDANKGGYSRNRLTNLDIQDFSRVFSLFSLQTYEKRLFKMSKTVCLNFIEKSRDNLQLNFIAEDYLKDLLSAACLLVEDGLEIAFSHRSFQEYFVAVYISSASPEIQEKLIERYSETLGMDSVMELLYEINPELVERLFLVPKLQEVFSKIGVKRKVGITHAAKYFKSILLKVVFSEKKIREIHFASFEVNEIVAMVNRHSNRYSIQSNLKLEMEEVCTQYFKNHSHGSREKVELYFSTLTYRDPFFSGLLKSNGRFSIQYLQVAFDIYCILKKKHDHQSDDLEKLLGI